MGGRLRACTDGYLLCLCSTPGFPGPLPLMHTFLAEFQDNIQALGVGVQKAFFVESDVRVPQ